MNPGDEWREGCDGPSERGEEEVRRTKEATRKVRNPAMSAVRIGRIICIVDHLAGGLGPDSTTTSKISSSTYDHHSQLNIPKA